MTKLISRFLPAMLLVAFSVTSAYADDSEASSSEGCDLEFLDFEYCRSDPAKYASTCSSVAACRKSSAKFEQYYQVWLKMSPNVATAQHAQFTSAPAEKPPTRVILSTEATQVVEEGGGQQVVWPTSAQGADPAKRPIRDLGFAPNKSPWGVACKVMVQGAPSNARLPSDLCDRFAASSYGLDPLDGLGIICKDNVEIVNGSAVNGQIYQGDRKVPRLEINRAYQFNASVSHKDRLAKICYIGMWNGLHLTVHQPYKCNNYSYVLSREKVWVATDNCAQRRKIGINIVSFTKLSDEMRGNAQFVSAVTGGRSQTVSKTFGKALHIEANRGAFADEPHKVRITMMRGEEMVDLGTHTSVNGQVFIDIEETYAEYALKMEMVNGSWKEVCRSWFNCTKGCVGTRYYTAVLQ